MDKEFYSILAKSVSMAVGTLNEPPIYGSFRIIQLLELFLEYAAGRNGISENDHSIILNFINSAKDNFMNNEDEYRASVKLLAKEAINNIKPV